MSDLIYIPDLPSNFEEIDLQNKIHNRLKAILRTQGIFNIKCHVNLNLAVIELRNAQDKEHLISNIESIVFDAKNGINISFVDQIDLVSYIVFHGKNSKIPSINEIKRFCSQFYQISTDLLCEKVSHQFTNIFRIRVQTINELVKIANTPAFTIDQISAIVYPRADCNYFEDLPRNTDSNKIKSIIATQIGEEGQLRSSSFYVQCNKNTGSAILIALKSVKKWSNETRTLIDGQYLLKKSNLSYRVAVSPVPHDVHDITRILQHELFVGHAISNKYDEGNLIVELDSMNSYKKCLQIGALRVNNHVMKIDDYAIVSQPDTGEINEQWYENEMEKIPGDIREMIGNSSHPIFYFLWNAQAWKQQMKKVEELENGSKRYNVLKHLLRVIVMLHTYGTLKKMKYVVDGHEISLTLEKLQTIGYDHRSKLLRGTKIFENQFQTEYPSTTVKVINEDCLVVYEKLVSEGRRPLLLNMANQSKPGGGYYSGDGAQEENSFRRGDYLDSLDSQLADANRSTRLIRTAQFQDKSFTGFGNYYPMEDFGAIYTSGLKFFRGTEADGYPYMKEPLHNVCCLAMAAYRCPKLVNLKRLDKRTAMNTRKKIENIFSIAYQRKHDCLVLSAFGCGAYKNAPEHIVLLFKCVIHQFAGYFHTIYFAIIDDHNAKRSHNPDGNFLPFQKLLDGLIVYPSKSLRMNSVTGPYRILNKTSDEELTLSDVSILDVPPCEHGNNCRDMKKADHIRQYSHPARCPFQSATSSCEQMNDDVHASTFSHTTKCEHGGECTNDDVEHLNDYDHPGFCKDKHECNNLRLDHLREFRHIPICPDGANCMIHLEGEANHMKMFRHCKHICPQDNCCIQFNDVTHMKTALHSFRKPCPLTPYKCSQYVEFFQCKNQRELGEDVLKHCLEYSHMCPYGRQCRTKDAQHYQTTFHIARHFCPDADKCTKLNEEDHLETYTHSDHRDIRLLCKHPGFLCQSRLNTDHQRIYRHKQNFDHLGVIPASHLNSKIRFDQNQRNLIKMIKSYMSSQNITLPNIVKDVCQWIRALQPVHKCGPKTFTSILIHGHVMSRHFMNLLERPGVVANAVLQHNQVRSILLKHNILTKSEKPFQLIKALVMSEFAKVGTDEINSNSLDPEHEENINRAKIALRASLNNDELETRYAPVQSDWVPSRTGHPVAPVAQSDWLPGRTGHPVGLGTQSRLGHQKRDLLFI